MLKVLRLDTSSYQKKDFAEREKALVEKLGLEWLENFSPEADILISNSNTEFSKISPSEFKKLKLVIHPNSGYDNVTLPWAQAGIPLIVGHEIRMHAVIEYTLSCLLGHTTKPPFVSSWDKKRAWERILLKEKRVQLIGFGHIGSVLASALKPLVKELFIYDPFKGLKELFLEKSDIVILAAGLNPSSEKILSKETFAKLPSHALIINGARGKLIDEDALCFFLKHNEGAFAYLDVFEKEPCDFEKFKGLANLSLSSHVAGVYTQLDNQMLSFEEKILGDFSKLSLSNFKEKYKDEDLQNRIFKDYIL